MVGTRRCLVVGAGIAGLAASAALRRARWEVDLVDRARDWRHPGAALILQPNALQAIESLGLGDAFCELGQVVTPQAHCNREGTVVAEVDLARPWGALGPPLAMTRKALHELLLGAAGVAVRMGVEPSALADRGDGCLAAFSDGSVALYDLVVGADGIRSDVRRLLGIAAEVRFARQSYWRGLVELDNPGQPWKFTPAPGRFVTLITISPGRTFLVAQVNTSEPFEDPVAGRRKRLRERFADFGPLVERALSAIPSDDTMHFGPVFDVRCERWFNDNSVLIGDAAHALSPILTQGGAMALEDAVVLGEEMARASTVKEGLRAFADRRGPRLETVRTTTEAAVDRARSGANVPSAESLAANARRTQEFVEYLSRPV